jgi:hypothetical protein
MGFKISKSKVCRSSKDLIVSLPTKESSDGLFKVLENQFEVKSAKELEKYRIEAYGKVAFY